MSDRLKYAVEYYTFSKKEEIKRRISRKELDYMEKLANECVNDLVVTSASEKEFARAMFINGYLASYMI